MWEPLCFFVLGWGALAILARAVVGRRALGEAVRVVPGPRDRSLRPRR